VLRSRRMALRVAIFLLASVICFFVAESIARRLQPYSISYPWIDHINGIVAPLPNVHGRHFVPGTYDTTFSFSSQRFRGQQTYTMEPGPRVIRIAILGASSAFGSGANDADAYPFQLQSILQEQSKRNGSPLTYEVINAAIPGTVVAEQALWYENWVKRFHPQVVVLNIACVADYVTGIFLMDESGHVTPRTPDELQAANKGSGAIRQLATHIPGYIFLTEHSELLNLLELEMGDIFRRKRNAALADGIVPRKPDGTSHHLQEDALSLEMAEVMWLKTEVEGSGARLAVVILPCRENVYSSQSPQAKEIERDYAAVVAALRDLTAKEDIPLAEVAPALRKTATQSQQLLYYDGRLETHPTPAGYRLIAKEVAAFLLESGLTATPGGSRAP
jgi:SGNH hydrolase-like domain, acetyltransferase AlgX